MAATTAGAFKAYLETLGLALTVHRDGYPQGVAPTYPHAVVQEAIATSREQHGDYDDPDAHQGTTELVQVDLYQLARVLDPAAQGRAKVAEQYDLADKLEAALNRVRGLQPHAPHRVYGVTTDGGRRWPIEDNVIRHTWTVRVRRDTARRA